MNLSFIYESGASFIVATVILVLLLLLIVGAVFALVVTLKKERAYARTALPALEGHEEVVEEELDSDDMQVLPESVFSIEEETQVLEDQDANELMADIDRAKSAEKTGGTHSAKKPSGSLLSIFKKKD